MKRSAIWIATTRPSATICFGPVITALNSLHSKLTGARAWRGGAAEWLRDMADEIERDDFSLSGRLQ
jgi:hypothetical protein